MTYLRCQVLRLIRWLDDHYPDLSQDALTTWDDEADYTTR